MALLFLAITFDSMLSVFMNFDYAAAFNSVFTVGDNFVVRSSTIDNKYILAYKSEIEEVFGEQCGYCSTCNGIAAILSNDSFFKANGIKMDYSTYHAFFNGCKEACIDTNFYSLTLPILDSSYAHNGIYYNYNTEYAESKLDSVLVHGEILGGYLPLTSDNYLTSAIKEEYIVYPISKFNNVFNSNITFDNNQIGLPYSLKFDGQKINYSNLDDLVDPRFAYNLVDFHLLFPSCAEIVSLNGIESSVAVVSDEVFKGIIDQLHLYSGLSLEMTKSNKDKLLPFFSNHNQEFFLDSIFSENSSSVFNQLYDYSFQRNTYNNVLVMIKVYSVAFLLFVFSFSTYVILSVNEKDVSLRRVLGEGYFSANKKVVVQIGILFLGCFLLSFLTDVIITMVLNKMSFYSFMCFSFSKGFWFNVLLELLLLIGSVVSIGLIKMKNPLSKAIREIR